MKIVVFGAGYVGLVTGAGLADLGNEVRFVDTDPEKIARLREGDIPIYEPGLAELLWRNISAERVTFCTSAEYREADPATGLHEADIYFIAVGTPPGPDGAADVGQVFAVADTIASLARQPALVVVKSTVPVGTTDAVQERLGTHTLEAVSNPEFLKEGDALNDFFKPDRIVVGARSEHAHAVMRELYAPIGLSGERPLVATDPRSSELVKYAANTMLAMRISFMNEVARLCHSTGANVHDVRLGVGTDSRIGKKFLYAGPGYGGSCFPKDVQAMAAMGRARGLPMRLAEAAQLANLEQSHFLAALVEEVVGDLKGKTVAFWGLAFKPETDDVREAPALRLAEHLLAQGAIVVGHDPEAGQNFWRAMNGQVPVAESEYVALGVNGGADALVLLTEWRCYRAPDFDAMARGMKPGAVVVDARNIWRPSDVTRAGLRYRGIGVPHR